MVDMYIPDQAGLASRWSNGRTKETGGYGVWSVFWCATAPMEIAIMHSFQIAGRWIAAIAVCACVLTGCAQLNSGAGEGSSLPPSASGSYVFPPADLQAYD
jgi:hypothetical protein